MKPRVRWYLLCEDREQEKFFGQLGERLLGSRPLRIAKLPKGEGAAWGWVLKRYPEFMRYPRRYPAENVALVVVVDGDNEGHHKRKGRFDAELKDRGMNPRAQQERVAICVPTWCIETWLAWLCQWQPPSGAIDEGRSFKTEVKKAIEDGVVDFGAAVMAWNQLKLGDHATPSLNDGRQEMGRLTPA